MNTNPSQFLNFVYLKRFNNIHLFLFKIRISLAHYREPKAQMSYSHYLVSAFCHTFTFHTYSQELLGQIEPSLDV